MPVPSVGLWVTIGGVQRDLSSRVRGVTITRGAGKESSALQPGACSLILANDDGALSVGSLQIPYGAPVAVRGVKTDAATVRFTGVATSWRATASPTGTTSTVAVTCVDAAGLLQTPLESMLWEWLKSQPIIACWPLTDAAAPAMPVVDVTAPPLAPEAVYSGGGELGWQAGTGAATDEVGALMLTNPSSTSGTRLASTAAVSVPSNYGSVWVAAIVNPTSTGTIAEWRTAETVVQIWHDSTANKTWLLTGSATDRLTWGRDSMVELSSTSGTRLVQGSVNAALLRGATLRVGGGMNYNTNFIPTSERVLQSGTVSYVMVASAQLTAYPTKASTSATAAMNRLLGWVGSTTPTTFLGANRSLAAMATGGRTVADCIGDMAAGALAIVYATRSGTLTWRDYTYEGTAYSVSATRVAPSAFELAQDALDRTTRVTMTLLDGKTYAYDSGLQPLVLREMRASLASDDDSRAVAQIVASADPSARRIPTATVDLILDAALLPADLGDRLTITGLPSQLGGTQTATIAGYAETIGAQSWSMALALAPLGVRDWWVLGDPIKSLVDGTRKLAPLA